MAIAASVPGVSPSGRFLTPFMLHAEIAQMIAAITELHRGLVIFMNESIATAESQKSLRQGQSATGHEARRAHTFKLGRVVEGAFS
jgi:hypothetical protein